MAILHPDQGISFGYEGHTFKLKDGNTAVGIVSSETETEVELVLPGGIKNRISKNNIASREQMKNSMMPAGLQAAMSQNYVKTTSDSRRRRRRKASTSTPPDFSKRRHGI